MGDLIDDELNLKALKKQVRILHKKLERSEADRKELENARDLREAVLKNVILDLEKSHAVLEERGQALESALRDLKTLQMKLVESEKMSALGIMVAGIAHEINNPVSFIYGNLEHANDYLQDVLRLVQLYQKHYPETIEEIQKEIDTIDLDFLKTDAQNLFQSMNLGAERITEIVKSLRIFSRLDESEHKLANIHEGLDSTIIILNNRLKPSANNPQGIKLIRDYGMRYPTIQCFPGALNQVFMNIIANSIDALDDVLREESSSQAFIPTIKISTKLSKQNSAIIQISDNGAGIPENISDRLFDPFFTTKPVGQGTGLGLAISYQIVTEKHKGRIWYESQSGQGIMFTIELPAR